MEVYRSLAAILASSPSNSSSPTSLIVTQLSVAPNQEKPALCRVLAELLRFQSTPDHNAQTVLHNYIRNLVSTVDLGDISTDLRLAVELADDKLLVQILDETVENVDTLLYRAEKVHVSSDEAFVVEFAEFLKRYHGTSKARENQEETAELDRGLHDTVIRQLRFWHFLFILEGSRADCLYDELYRRIADVLPARLLSVMALRDFAVAQAASNTLCCFINGFHQFPPAGSSEMLWDGISRLLNAEVHADLALALWLRWIAATSENVKPTQEILAQDGYWTLIQKCLATGFSERRKYSLHLLMTSISLTQRIVNTSNFFLDPKNRVLITAAWSKFTTLIEIASLSTSPNQLRDAAPDLKRLLDPSSYVPASWVVVLTALGFQAGSGGVSRAFWDFLISLEKDRLGRLFEGPEGRKLLQDVILPFAAYASNFIVGCSAPEKCEHGTQLATWIGRILSAGDDGMMKLNARAVLTWIDKTQDNLFAPARAWVLKGLLEGVEGKAVFDEIEDLKLLVTIAKMQRFTKMKVDVCLAIVLRLLLAVDIEKVGVREFWNALAEISVKKEYLLSPKYMMALVERFGPAAVERDMFFHVTHMAFSSRNETPPPRVEILKGALVLYWLSCGEEFPPGCFPELEAWLKDLNKTHVGFWAVLLGNRQLFSRVNTIFGGPTILRTILGDYTGNEAELAKILELWPSEGFTSRIPKDAVDKCPLPRIFQSRWVRLLDTEDQGFEQSAGRGRAYSAAICANCVKFVGNGIFERIRVDDIVGIIDAFGLPKLGRNKHVNAEMTATAGKFIAAMLYLLTQAILYTDELDTPTVTKVLLALPRLMRFLENESLLRALEVIRSVATKAPQQLLEFQRLRDGSLESLIMQLWETVDAATLRSDFIKAYLGFVETLFHPVIISATVDNEGLKNTISTITNEIMKLGNGRRSIKPAIAKAIREAFLHTSEHPHIIGRSKWLIDIVIDMILWSPSPKDVDIFIEHPLTVLFDEVAPEVNHYAQYYGDCEVFSQVYMFDMLSRMDENDHDQLEFVKTLREKLFLPWTENFIGMSVWIAWKKHNHLQTLVLLERFVEADDAGTFLDRVINKALSNEPHPRFRFLFEWIISLCILRFPEHRNCIWRYLQYPVNQNPKLQVSLLRVALMVARNLAPPLREEYFTELVHTAIPLTSNTKVVVRHQAIAMQIELWEDANAFSFSALTQNPLFERTHRAVTTSSYYKDFKNAKDFRTFDGIGNYTLSSIFSGSYLRGGDEIETIPASAFSALPQDCGVNRHRLVPLGTQIPPPTTAIAPEHSGKVEYNKHDATQLTALSSAPLQTKASPASQAAGKSLIVVASLLENAFNLGGLSRVSEIMGVSTLALHSKAVTKTSEFMSVSVHSESWLDILEVPASAITVYLREKRSEGYAAVGVEQTDRSVVLGQGQWRFPEKTVLLFGTEKFGIPAQLLGELDWCVEIPQRGITRSMNVQTAAAVVLYEVARQNVGEREAADRSPAAAP